MRVIQQLRNRWFGPRAVVLVTAGQCGSTWLLDLLSGQPDLAVHAELQNTYRLAGAQETVISETLTEARRAGRTAVLRIRPRRAADPDALVRELARHRPRVVRLIRRNTVKQTVSRLRAGPLADAAQALTGRRIPHLYDWLVAEHPGLLETARAPSEIAPDTLVDALARTRLREDEADRFAARLGAADILSCAYEDLQADPGRFVAGLCTKIGVAPPGPAGPHTGVLKRTPDDLRAVIGNFEACRAALGDTAERAMLEDNGPGTVG